MVGHQDRLCDPIGQAMISLKEQTKVRASIMVATKMAWTSVGVTSEWGSPKAKLTPKQGLETMQLHSTSL